MTTYYIRADGTASKANAVGPASDSTACMSVATHNAASFDGGDVILLSDQGGDFTSRILAPTGGVIYRAVTDEYPTIRRSTLIPAETSWTEAGDTYYVAVPNMPDSMGCWVDGTTVLARDASADLSPGEYWADTENERLYVRLSDDSDPGDVDIYYNHNGACFTALNRDDLTIDGLAFQHGGTTGSARVVYLYRCDDWALLNCTWEYNANALVRSYECSGVLTNTGGTMRHNWTGRAYGEDGAGPALMVDSNAGMASEYVFTNNIVHHNYLGFRQLDGTPNTVAWNLFYANYVNAVELNGTLPAPGNTFTHNTVYHRPHPDVIVDNGHGIIMRDYGNAAATIKSNCFYFDENGVPGAELVQFSRSDHPYIDIDYNAYYALDTPLHTFNYDGGTTNSLAVWQAWLDTTEYLGNDDNSLQVDPQFVDIDNLDFRVQTHALRNAGHDGVTIGAFEYATPARGLILQAAGGGMLALRTE